MSKLNDNIKKLILTLQCFRAINISRCPDYYFGGYRIKCNIEDYKLTIFCDSKTYGFVLTTPGNITDTKDISYNSPVFSHMIFIYNKIMTSMYIDTTRMELSYITFELCCKLRKKLEKCDNVNYGFATIMEGDVNLCIVVDITNTISENSLILVYYVTTSVDLNDISRPEKGLSVCVWRMNEQLSWLIPFADSEVVKVSPLTSELEITDPEVQNLLAQN